MKQPPSMTNADFLKLPGKVLPECVNPDGLNDTRVADALETCQQIIQESIPNLLRPYLNPWVAQVCLYLNHCFRELPGAASFDEEPCPSFLANSTEEALSGAIKLARYVNHTGERSLSGRVLILDTDNRLPWFASASISTSEDPESDRLVFLPGITHLTDWNRSWLKDQLTSAVAVVYFAGRLATEDAELIRTQCSISDLLTIAIFSRSSLVDPQTATAGLATGIAVFDDSFVDSAVPFAAFTSRESIMRPWMSRSMAMFHSTTFQPNTLSARHFIRTLQKHGDDDTGLLLALFEAVTVRPKARVRIISELLSPSLTRLSRLCGMTGNDVSASGAYVSIGDRRVFDGVAGVACSVRGHNPVSFVHETQRTLRREADLESELASMLSDLTGLPHFLPAVSGASAVEQALKAALLAQPERRTILALKGGFGGKTLFALTGTASDYYRRNIGPLYPDVVYVDPFATDARQQIQDVLEIRDVGIVHLELIQGVGGVRPIPGDLLQWIEQRRQADQFLLSVDEVQTGMYRTGPFLRSTESPLSPDLVTIGKGTSDMMFPFAGVLYSHRVSQMLRENECDFPKWIRKKYGYAVGYAALVNTLRRAEQENWRGRVLCQQDQFRRRLADLVTRNGLVCDVRIFGMLMGIELKTTSGTSRQTPAQLASLAMFYDTTAPVMIGFCQYEKNVLKLTPSLILNDEEIETVCDTMHRVLSLSPIRLLLRATGILASNALFR